MAVFIIHPARIPLTRSLLGKIPPRDTVSNMLGHKDSSMTLEVYARYVKQSDKKRAVFLSKGLPTLGTVANE